MIFLARVRHNLFLKEVSNSKKGNLITTEGSNPFMNKIILVLLCLLLFGSVSFADEFSVNVEYGMPSQIDYNRSVGVWNEVYTDPGGIGIGVSYFGSINEKVELGGGGTFFLPRTLKNVRIDGVPFIIITDANFNYLPLYGRIKFTPRPESKVKFYVGGDLRYAIISVGGTYFTGISAQGGLGYGFFGGIMFAGEGIVELGYIMQNGTISGPGYSGNFTDNYLYLKGGYSIL